MNLNDIHYIQDDNLSYLSSQGVLLLNAALTVEKDKPGSHLEIWAPFTNYLLSEIIATTGVPVLYLGSQAAQLSVVTATTNPSYVLNHPAHAAYTGKPWETEGVFTKINKHIWDSNKDTILWLPLDPPF